MAGILNSKQRIMDVIITNNGRRQIADNAFNIRFASFSDHGVFYSDDGTGVGDAAEDRIMFEAHVSNTDIIIPEINDKNGISIDTSAGSKITNSKFFTSGSTQLNTSTIKTGSINIFSSSAEIIKTAIDNFDRLQIIGTDNGFAEEKYFKITKSKAEFDEPNQKVRSLTLLPPTFADKSLANQINFRYMPPVCEVDNNITSLGMYPKLQKEPIRNFDYLLENLYDGSQYDSFDIDSTNSTDLLCQVFENTENEILKLAIVDYGSYYDNDGNFKGHIYHLGKTYRDKNNVLKFVKLFCILFE